MTKKANELMLEKLLEVSVGDCYFYNESTGQEMFTATLSSHSIEQTADKEDIKAGRDNETIATIYKSKDLSFTITDVVSRLDMEAFKYGSKTGAKDVGAEVINAFHMPKNYTVKLASTKKSITLANEPNSGEEVILYNLKTSKEIETSKFTRTKKEIEITDETILEGDIIFVGGFHFKAKTDDRYFDIATDSTMATLMAVLEVPVFDAKTMSLKYTKQYIFPKVAMDASFTSAGQSEKSAPSMETKVTVQKADGVNYLGRVVMVKPEVI